jgi:hypothetical protein
MMKVIKKAIVFCHLQHKIVFLLKVWFAITKSIFAMQPFQNPALLYVAAPRK